MLPLDDDLELGAGSSGRALRAALQTPDAEYVIELAEDPPIFTNNRQRFAQWDTSLISASPQGGPIRGNTSILLRGRGLRTLPTGEQPLCRFGVGAQVNATLFADGRFARCVSPPATTAGVVPLALSLNSEEVCAAVQIEPPAT